MDVARPVADEIDLRWFAGACMRTLDECLVQIVGLFKRPRKSGYWMRRVLTNWIDGSLVPLMLADISEDGSVVLNWFHPYGTPFRERDFAKSLIREAPSRKETDKFLDALDLDGRRLVEAVSRRLR